MGRRRRQRGGSRRVCVSNPRYVFLFLFFITIDYLQIDLIVQKGAETTTTGTGREWGADDDNGGVRDASASRAPGMLFSFLYILLKKFTSRLRNDAGTTTIPSLLFSIGISLLRTVDCGKRWIMSC
jgi:hypothetical protein